MKRVTVLMPHLCFIILIPSNLGMKAIAMEQGRISEMNSRIKEPKQPFPPPMGERVKSQSNLGYPNNFGKFSAWTAVIIPIVTPIQLVPVAVPLHAIQPLSHAPDPTTRDDNWSHRPKRITHEEQLVAIRELPKTTWNEKGEYHPRWGHFVECLAKWTQNESGQSKDEFVFFINGFRENSIFKRLSLEIHLSWKPPQSDWDSHRTTSELQNGWMRFKKFRYKMGGKRGECYEMIPFEWRILNQHHESSDWIIMIRDQTEIIWNSFQFCISKSMPAHLVYYLRMRKVSYNSMDDR